MFDGGHRLETQLVELTWRIKRTICLVLSDKPSWGRGACKIWTTDLHLKIQCVPLQLCGPLGDESFWGSPKPEGHLELGLNTDQLIFLMSVVESWVVNLLDDLQNLGTKTPTHPMISHPITFHHHCQKLSIGNESVEYLAHWYWRTECPMARVLWRKMPAVCLGPEWSSPDRSFSHPQKLSFVCKNWDPPTN